MRSQVVASIAFLAVLLSCFNSGAAISAPAFTHPEPGSLTPKLAPIEPESRVLVAGVQFSEEYLPKFRGDCVWYRIPEWFAGTWHRQEVTTSRDLDLKRNHESKLVTKELCSTYDEEGWQQDGAGGIWNCEHVPFRSESIGNGYRQVFIVSSLEPVEVTEKVVVKEFKGRGIVIESATGKIRYSAPATSLQTYQLVEPGVVACKSVTTEFDTTGRPVRITETASVLKRIKPFEQRNVYRGKDMRAAFKVFLCNEGKVELLPDATSMVNGTLP